MRVVVIHRPGAPPERRALPLAVTGGGSRADDLHLPGAPPAAVRLLPCAEGLIVEPLTGGVRVRGRLLAAGSRRLLRAGDRAELHGSAVALDATPAPCESTRVAAASLLRRAAEGAAPIAGSYLVVLTGPAAGTRHALGPEQTLGRGRAATIRIADPHASRVHARLRLARGGVEVEDLSSKNGVRVNGVRIERRGRVLRTGDEIEIGGTALALEDGCPAGDVASPAPGPASGERRGRAARRLVTAVLLALSAAALALAAR